MKKITLIIVISLFSMISQADVIIDAVDVLPPNPGEAGKLTVEGIDSDSDGIRDDVQIAVFTKYPNNELHRNKVLNSVKKLQKIIIEAESDITQLKQIQNFQDYYTAIKCMSLDSETSKEDIDFINSQIFNTRERILAYAKFNSVMNASITDITFDEANCIKDENE